MQPHMLSAGRDLKDVLTINVSSCKHQKIANSVEKLIEIQMLS